MSAFRFANEVPDGAPDAWRPLDRALHRWVLAHGGSALLAMTAAWASHADGEGDTALPLRDAAPGREGLPAWSGDDIAALRAQPMVTADDAGPLRPFVLDADDRFYLWRNRRDESRVIAAVRARRATATPASMREADLDALFDGRDDEAVAPQRAAVRDVAGRRLFVLTGGPGTGKTTTVLRMLLRLQRAADAPLAIALAAPTGKAAQRLAQALRDGRRSLPEGRSAPLSGDWPAWVGRIPEEAQTLHRLLGHQPWNGRFARHAGNPLPADVVVVDEASMVDLSMLRALLEALRPEATLVLVGDADQLASIGAGSALMDLVAVMEDQQRGDLVRLRHGFRAQRTLAAVHESVRAGDAAAFAAAWRAAGDAAVMHEVADARALARRLRAWSESLAAAGPPPNLPADATAAAVAREALRALAHRQLLCALREGPYGALAAAATIEHHLREAWRVRDGETWYPGRAIIITRNDYAAGLFNGDVGICLHDADGVARVFFESGDDAVAHGRGAVQIDGDARAGSAGEGGTGVRSFLPDALPPHESAYAITVHKSQGSEYDRVAVLLPPDPRSAVLSRQLLYTALSRARVAVESWHTDAALAAALARSVRRAGGLATRLRLA